MPKSPLKNLSADELEAIAVRFRALGEASRLSLLRALMEKERSVNELVDLSGLSQSNVSRHLALLLNAGLVGRRKDGVNVLYRIIDESLRDMCHLVCQSALE